MIRVLHAVGNMDFGGVETLLINLYRCIDRSVVQFDFLEQNDTPGKYDPEIVTLGGRVYRVPGIGKSSLSTHQRALRAQFRTLDHETIVHSHLDRMNGILLQEARRAGISTRISHAHNHNTRYGFPRELLRFYSKLLIGRNATHGFACSRDAATFVHSGRLGSETSVLPNAIDTAKFSPSPGRRAKVRQTLGFADELILGHVGRFETQKNHAQLIDIFCRLLGREPNARLLLVGVGSLEEVVREDVAARGIRERVSFLGSRSDVRDLMDAMDVFLFPSHNEGLGIVAVEAQSMGLPTLVSEAVPRETNLTDRIQYLPLNDPSLWVEATVKAAAERETLDRSGYNQQVAAGGYEIRNVAAALQQFYVDVAAGEVAEWGAG